MKATQQFIEDAIKGGWKERFASVQKMMDDGKNVIFNYYTGGSTSWRVSEILLDPLAWEAVGKTRGWSKEINEIPYNGTENIWVQYIHEFIGNVASGDTFEKALEALENR